MNARKGENIIGVLIVGHGSRDERSNLEFTTLVHQYQLHRPTWDIRFSYTELVHPQTKVILKEMASVRDTIVIVPLFLFNSGHVKNDLPLIISNLKSELRSNPRADLESDFPKTQFLVAQSFGIHPKLIELMFDRVREKHCEDREKQSKRGMIIVSRGSSDSDANSDFHKVVRIFEEGNNYAFVFPSFIGITRPLLPQSLEIAAKLRPDSLSILPYFLFGGQLIRKIENTVNTFSTQYPWIKSSLTHYFGPDPIFVSLIDEKVNEALQGRGLLPCVTCEYRKQLPGLPNKVGGLKALLWSLRHMETHSQAAPHPFPHRNLKKHILICENVDCAEKGSIPLVTRIRSLLKEHKMQREFKVTRTSCMGRCGEGPVVVVYPDGVWYQGVQLSDAEDLVFEHFFNDRLVSRRVDNIMQ